MLAAAAAKGGSHNGKSKMIPNTQKGVGEIKLFYELNKMEELLSTYSGDLNTTSLVFKWSKRGGGMPNGPVFEYHLNAGIYDLQKMASILSKPFEIWTK